jgi:hypothetical protein
MADVKSFQEQVKRGDLNGIRATLAEDPALLEATNESGQPRANNGQCALDLALSGGHQEVAALLEELGAKLR